MQCPDMAFETDDVAHMAGRRTFQVSSDPSERFGRDGRGELPARPKPDEDGHGRRGI